MQCPTCKSDTVELIPNNSNSNMEVITKVSIQWCPKCGTTYHDVDDDNDDTDSGWHIPIDVKANP